jgi:retron-type reverse transcriptase
VIPTAVDRVLQQAIAQVLSPIFEPQFVETSYGFRKSREKRASEVNIMTSEAFDFMLADVTKLFSQEFL